MTLVDVINQVFQGVIDSTSTLLSWAAGQFVIAIVAIGLLFYLVKYVRKGE